MVNKWVLSSDLKLFKDWEVLTLVGREFQAPGPAELNDELWH